MTPIPAGLVNGPMATRGFTLIDGEQPIWEDFAMRQQARHII